MAVSPKKNKLLEEAQKFSLRGQFDKAVNAYEQILELEPTAINHRQKLAELLIKCGWNDNARKELETIGSHFSKGGFYLKAIAVYKQLQKLFPADISISLTLAELNEKHGLGANALSEYKLVYEYHVKAGDIPEALAILVRMQTVDPQNIPIKIKLAETYLQQDRTTESLDVFAKITSLLLERDDSDTLTRICTRARQILPGEPDFLLEILTGQLNRQNAATAVKSLQSLLRGNPKNKLLWDLIVQAYQLLEQPQQVKKAFQHYLNFFPSEPAAILGSIACAADEHDLAGALELLDRHEAALISAGYLQQLEQLYHSLDKIDSAGGRIQEGLMRIASAAGNEHEARTLATKLTELQSAFEEEVDEPSTSEPLAAFDEEPVFGGDEADDAADVDDLLAIPEAFPAYEAPVPESSPTPTLAPDIEPCDADTASDDNRFAEEEIEIDIDIDDNDPFKQLGEEPGTESTDDSWLDSVDSLFDAIDTTPRGVKFGNEMDSSDMQSHFDLGQGFKEMGLYDEAINEFRQASHDPLRRVECLIMLCTCLRERGEPDTAITMLQALLKQELGEEDRCAVKYELASAFEAAGNPEEARILLNEINSTTPGFRDISVRLNTASIPESLDFSDEDLKDF